MRALHLPGIPSGQTPPFSFPSQPPSPSDLVYTATKYPIPSPSPTTTSSEYTYLIRVLATALTRGELTWQEILEPPRFRPHGSAIPGHDVVGIVEQVFPAPQSPSEPKFSPGDKVWALLGFDRDGAAAEYTEAKESELSLAPVKPNPKTIADETWDEQLATLPLSGLTAYQALFTHGNLPSPKSTSTDLLSKRILILGAAGSVGLPTLQLAKANGFTVIATASSASISLLTPLLDLPTDTLIDYTSSSYTSVASSFHTLNLPPVDLILDCIGGSTLSSLLTTTTPSLNSIIRPTSKITTIVAPIKVFGESLSAEIEANCRNADVQVDFFIVEPSGTELDELSDWVRQGKLKGYVHGEKVFGLEEGREAMGVVEARGRKGGGKVVIRVASG
jgi:NADPH:quinone reductase-like Zn-dependent oxidoreductase